MNYDDDNGTIIEDWYTLCKNTHRLSGNKKEIYCMDDEYCSMFEVVIIHEIKRLKDIETRYYCS